MKTRIILFSIVLLINELQAQNIDKYISEKSITRVIRTLSADDMMGRSAVEPERIEKATAFIEKEFKKIGLATFNGLSTYRQEFQKQRISPQTTEIVIDGESVSDENLLLISEKPEINIAEGLVITYITYDSSTENKNQYFFTKAFTQLQDTSSSIVLVAPEYQSNFNEFKGIVGKRFANGQKSTKVFILGKTSASQYSIKAEQKIESIKMTNVVCQLTGKTKPEEMIVFSAHYDHLGIQKPEINGDSIANGADDNASGTTAVIALARYFKKKRNNTRTLVFIAFTGEELRGFGSKYFSEQLNPDKVVAMLNIEMIGKPSKWGKHFAFITGYERSDLGEILQRNLSGTPFEFKPDPYPQQDLFYRSDNATLARLGVPAHTISTDQIDVDKFYHTVDDEVETLDMENITATVRAIAAATTSIVDGTDTPKRIDKATVK